MVGEGRDHDQRNENCGDQSEGFRVGQRFEELAFGGLHSEHRKKADDGRGDRGGHRSGDLGAGAKDGLEQVLVRFPEIAGDGEYVAPTEPEPHA